MKVNLKAIEVVKELDLTIKLSGANEIERVMDGLDTYLNYLYHYPETYAFVNTILNEYKKLKK